MLAQASLINHTPTKVLISKYGNITLMATQTIKPYLFYYPKYKLISMGTTSVESQTLNLCFGAYIFVKNKKLFGVRFGT